MRIASLVLKTIEVSNVHPQLHSEEGKHQCHHVLQTSIQSRNETYLMSADSKRLDRYPSRLVKAKKENKILQ